MNTKFVFSAFILSIFLFSGCSTPLLNDAAFNGELDSIKSIVSKDRRKLYEEDHKGRNPLHSAVIGGQLDVVKYLVSQGLDANAKDNYGDTPLHIAVSRYKIKIVEYLASQSVKLDSKDNDGRTPLHWASEFSSTKIVKILVSQGAHVNAIDNNGDSPIHLAAEQGGVEIIKYLVLHEADVNAVDNLGNTPLHNIVGSYWRKSKEKLGIVKLLVSKGADITKKNKNDRTAFDLAREKEYVTIEAFLSSQIQIAKQNETQIISSKKITEKEQNNKTFTIIRGVKEASTDTKVYKSSAGQYYALIIGNNNYQHIRKLETARKDAEAVSQILETQYGFQTLLLLDATRSDIVGAINQFRKSLTAEDQLLIYYAGHGEFNRGTGKAYWLPVDAKNDEDTNWIIADRITSNIKIIPSQHILIVSDSCYSGTFTRAGDVNLNTTIKRNRYIKKMQSKKSRTLLASGGNEPVSDIGGEGHSVFAKAFLSGLKSIENNKFTAEELYYRHIKEMVAGSSDQTPEYNIIRNSGHEGGDFIFKRID